ncbi:Ig-like domain-containing protein [Streptomyces sp. NPDC020412]|uniref:Ig-like domain-containing protein n=1 Tax=Streptomyces sp. NPDC020412 TaxID=3365073 RepID=UPI00378D2CBD
MLGTAVGCGSETKDKEGASPGSSGVVARTSEAAGSGQGSLLLRNDEVSATTAKASVVKVLDNDAASLADGTGTDLNAAFAKGKVELTVESGPGSGSAEVKDGAIVYTSHADYEGEDLINYRVRFKGEKDDMSASAALRITVTP